MGHKVHPTIFRMSVIYRSPSRWFSRFGSKEYRTNIRQDANIRKYLKSITKEAGLSKVSIERSSQGDITLYLTLVRPGLIIGRGGSGAEDLVKKIEKEVLKGANKVKINVLELKKPNLSAPVVGQAMANEIEKRMPFRRVMKQGIERMQKEGALGCRVVMGGRLNGAEIARREVLTWGKLPLQGLRADIDYAHTEAQTTYGVIGIKVWIYRGDIFEMPPTNEV